MNKSCLGGRHIQRPFWDACQVISALISPDMNFVPFLACPLSAGVVVVMV